MEERGLITELLYETMTAKHKPTLESI